MSFTSAFASLENVSIIKLYVNNSTTSIIGTVLISMIKSVFCDWLCEWIAYLWPHFKIYLLHSTIYKFNNKILVSLLLSLLQGWITLYLNESNILSY